MMPASLLGDANANFERLLIEIQYLNTPPGGGDIGKY